MEVQARAYSELPCMPTNNNNNNNVVTVVSFQNMLCFMNRYKVKV